MKRIICLAALFWTAFFSTSFSAELPSNHEVGCGDYARITRSRDVKLSNGGSCVTEIGGILLVTVVNDDRVIVLYSLPGIGAPREGCCPGRFFLEVPIAGFMDGKSEVFAGTYNVPGVPNASSSRVASADASAKAKTGSKPPSSKK